MSHFVVKGYQAPEGVRYKEQVEEVQRLIGAKVDGTWGGESQRKWEAFQNREPSRMSGYMLAYSMALEKGEKRHRESVRQARAEESLSALEYNRRQNAQARTVAGYTKPKEYQLVSQVEAFQRAHGLKVDGVWGPASQAAYQKSITQQTAPARTVKGYQKPAEYQSVWQVKQFQRSNGLKADGIWGPQTDAEYQRLKAPKVTTLGELKKQDAEAMQKLKAEQSTPARALKGYRVPAEYNTVFKLKVFQNKYGLKQDGVWGPDCEKAYQLEKQTARRTQEQREREQEQARAREQEQERLAEVRRNGQTPQDLDPTAAGMRGYNQMNIPRGTQGRSDPPATKAAAPQDSDPATQALRGPNSLKTTKSKTDTKTTGSGKQSPPDVNTDVMRGFHNPDYAEQDEKWVRTLPEPSIDKEDVVSDDPDAIATEERYDQSEKRYSWGNLLSWFAPIEDATLGEFNVGRDELQGRVPDDVEFTAEDAIHVNFNVIWNDRILVAHGGGTEEQKKRVYEQAAGTRLIKFCMNAIVGLPMGEVTDYFASTKLGKEILDVLPSKLLNEKQENIVKTVKEIAKSMGIDPLELISECDKIRKDFSYTQQKLSLLRKGDFYYRVQLKDLQHIMRDNRLQINGGYTEKPVQAPDGAITTYSEVLMYYRKVDGKEKLLFILLEDTMEIIWP